MKRLAALLALALFSLACGPQGSPDGSAPEKAERPDRGNKLVIGIQQEPDKLNSMLNAMVYGTYISQCIQGYFAKFDEKMELVPELLEEIPTLANGGISADGLTITYKLRKGVTWHDGHPLDADDVRFTWTLWKNPHVNCNRRRYMFDKLSAADVLDERGEIRNEGGVTPEPGLYVLGIRFMRRKCSNFIDGVGMDAEELSRHIEARRREPAA